MIKLDFYTKSSAIYEDKFLGEGIIVLRPNCQSIINLQKQNRLFEVHRSKLTLSINQISLEDDQLDLNNLFVEISQIILSKLDSDSLLNCALLPQPRRQPSSTKSILKKTSRLRL
ncbi:hypothetical protein TSAR_000189 [Trichomalopsis sarcophagae]|uniref:Uncharacterized protein n=1 Tax=Trichomalopsis sarcophagae TaxID=543379 RepID=A0A232EU28_9HYME|nr:hypothetical protein TSAR_000189 [Trichomalopsis sarcophagae]